METLSKILMVGSGGFIGSNIRYWLGGIIQHRLSAAVPWQTMIINVSGSLIIGLFMGMYLDLNWKENWRLFVAVGILGGYTTYSSFAYESLNLLRTGEYGLALLYVEGTATLTVCGAWIGLVISRIVMGGRT